MKDILTHRHYNGSWFVLQPHSLILLDLDDVVFTSKQYACSTTFFTRYFRAQNKTRTALVTDFYECQHATESVPVSNSLVSYFRGLSHAVLVFGLTARSINFTELTQAQIKSVGMRFSDYSNISNFISEGVIYAGYDLNTMQPNNKGAVLTHLLSSGYFRQTQHVIFVDDSRKNLEEVQAQLPDSVSFLGIHYTAARDVLFAAYSHATLDAMGAYQHNHLKSSGYLLSDQNYAHECRLSGSCEQLQPL